MRTERLVFVFGFVLIFLISFILPRFFLPLDVLNYLPSFSLNGWQRPHNSLLADPIYQFEPWRHYAKERILRGELPLWNDQNAAGTPFLANPQTAVFYPLNVLYYIFPEKVALWMIPLFKLYLFGIFTYYYLRVIKLSRVVSYIGSVTVSFSAFSLMWLLWPHTNVFIFLPLILYSTERIAVEKFARHRFYILLSLSYFCMILGGHPGTILHVTLVHFLYILIRFLRLKKRARPLILSVFCGFLLASFQLIPFYEYLLNSTAYEKRFLASESIYLPLKSIVMNLIPFILGAPHMPFYKQLSDIYNFQELAIGYVGLAIVLFTIVGLFVIKKRQIVYLWFGIIALCFFVSYGIWPFGYISKLPILAAVSNTRLMAFAGFGIIVLFCLILQQILQTKFVLKQKHFHHFLVFSLGLFFLYAGFEDIASNVILKRLPQKIAEFYPFLLHHLLYQFFSTLIFFGIILFMLSQKVKVRLKIALLLFIPLLIQSIFLFWNYNSVSNGYYPTTKLVKKLQTLPKGNILEVGNLNFPPNLNLMYGLSHSESDDAIEILSYRESFNGAFSIKNQWKRVDEVTLPLLQKFGIMYVISDYNINLTKQKVQPAYDHIVPITSSNPVTIQFKPNSEELRQIRMLTANYNRLNNCKLYISLQEVNTEQTLSVYEVSCKELRDFMYYTMNVFNDLKRDSLYKIIISSNSNNLNNTIGLWVDRINKPYVELLFDTQNHPFRMLWGKKSVFLWKVPNSNYISNGKILFESPERTLIKSNVNEASEFEIKRVQYPGWNAYLDGKKISIKKNKIFLTINLPSGVHVVEFKYEPLSFYMGIIVSVITFIVIMITLIKTYLKYENVSRFEKKWLQKAALIQKNESLMHHATIVTLSLLLGIVISLLVNEYIIPRNLSLPQTTAINWFTINNHSITLDYLRFGVFVITIPSLVITGWIAFIWLKKRS